MVSGSDWSQKNSKTRDTKFLLPFSGPICNFLSAVVSTTILINACHYCAAQVCHILFNILNILKTVADKSCGELWCG